MVYGRFSGQRLAGLGAVAAVAAGVVLLTFAAFAPGAFAAEELKTLEELYGAGKTEEFVPGELIVWSDAKIGKSDFDVSVFALSWRYSLLRTKRGEAGILAGLATYDIGLGLRGRAIIRDDEGNELEETFAPSGEDVIVPVPAFGMFVLYNVTPKLVFQARAQMLDAEIGDIIARYIDTRLTIDYFFNKTVGIGVGSNTTQVEYRDGGDKPVSVTYRQSGFLGYVSFTF